MDSGVYTLRQMLQRELKEVKYSLIENYRSHIDLLDFIEDDAAHDFANDLDEFYIELERMIKHIRADLDTVYKEQKRHHASEEGKGRLADNISLKVDALESIKLYNKYCQNYYLYN